MRKLRAFIAAPIGAALLLLALGSCANAPSTAGMPTVPDFDRSLFEGKWYEIARIPISIARDWVGTTDTYIRTGEGTWKVLYEGFKGGFDGKKGLMTQVLRIKDPARPGDMEAKPFPLVWMPYRLVYWNEADRTMLVTSGTVDFLWVMAKDPVPSEAAYAAAVARARELGFDVSRLERVPQRPE